MPCPPLRFGLVVEAEPPVEPEPEFEPDPPDVVPRYAVEPPVPVRLYVLPEYDEPPL